MADPGGETLAPRRIHHLRLNVAEGDPGRGPNHPQTQWRSGSMAPTMASRTRSSSRIATKERITSVPAGRDGRPAEVALIVPMRR